MFVVVQKAMPWQSPEMKCLFSDALKRKKHLKQNQVSVFESKRRQHVLFFIDVDNSYIA